MRPLLNGDTLAGRMTDLGQQLGLFHVDPRRARPSPAERIVGMLGIAVGIGWLALRGSPGLAFALLGGLIAISVFLKIQVRRLIVSLHEHGIAVFRLGAARAARWSDIRDVRLHELNTPPSLKLEITAGKPPFVPTCLQSWPSSSHCSLTSWDQTTTSPVKLGEFSSPPD
jgi:hypothetical protein